MDGSYWTVARKIAYQAKIQRSLFIGHTCPVASEEEAREFLSAVREEHSQATHNCYAYRIGLVAEPLTYFNDHGEPAGTAGRPILSAILQAGLTNTVIVVTRYFGGKKLGIRGLIDAYHSTAAEALRQAGKVLTVPSFTLLLTCDYPQLQPVNHLLQQYEILTEEADYGARVRLRLLIPENRREEFYSHLSGFPGVEWEEKNNRL